jgi:hypothetical protein
VQLLLLQRSSRVQRGVCHSFRGDRGTQQSHCLGLSRRKRVSDLRVAQFHVPDRELSVLGTGISVEGAAVLFEKSAKQHGVGAGVEDEAAGSKRPES